MHSFWTYLLVMAGITYLIRALPLALVKRKIENRFLLSFLYYVPYAVLTVMTVPAIFYATSSKLSACVGFAVAVVAAYFNKGLTKVAIAACAAVFVTEYVMTLF